MKSINRWIMKIAEAGLLMLLIFTITACISATGINKIVGDSWKEQIQLHDGVILTIKRSQTYKGRHAIDQSVPVGEHTVSFTLPQTGKYFTWTSEYGEELGRTNFNLLAVHVLDNTPYIVTQPNGCMSYNKWGRPNPPYVIFKYVDNAWQRIQISELPPEFSTLNVLISPRDADIQSRNVNAATVKQRNHELRNTAISPELRMLVREPIIKSGPYGMTGCEVLVRYKCGWGSPGEFNKKYFERTCK